MKILFSLFVLVSSLSFNAVADDHFPFLAQVVRPSVNVRSGPNINFSRVDQLRQGDEVVVVAKSYEWCKIRLRATSQAFIRADYIQVLDEHHGIINSDKVNVRAAANVEAAVLGQLAKESAIDLIAQKDGWWQIIPNDKVYGWVHQDFIVFKSQDIPAAPLMAEVKSVEPIKATTALPPVSVMTLKGQIKPVLEPTSSAKYMLIVDNQTKYYINDIDHLSDFNGATVDVQAVDKDRTKPSAHPFLDIQKISLVL